MSDYEQGFKDAIAAADAVVSDLEQRWRTSAELTRQRHTYTRGWPFRGTFVSFAAERSAKGIEAAANGLVAIRKVISWQKPKSK